MESSQNNKGLLPENGFYFDTPYITSLPPRAIELEYARKRLEKIRSTGKKLVEVSCDRVIEVLKKALKLGVTQAEFHIFKNNFHMRPYRNLQYWAKYCNSKTLEVDIDGLLNEVFETASLFKRPAVRDYFLLEIQMEFLDRYNEDWAETIFKINKKFSSRFEALEHYWWPDLPLPK